jgi:dihydroorotate dehydrogenase electron transfer subunit
LSYYYPATIIKARRENENVSTFILSVRGFRDSRPGQYVMAWLPHEGEIPLSLGGADDENVTLVIENVGRTSKKMYELSVGDRVFLRGPFGNSFCLDHGNRYLLAAGGVGAVPLLFAASSLSKNGIYPDYVGGGRSSRFALFKDEISVFSRRTFIATDDGSQGRMAQASTLAEELIGSREYDVVLTCGPERMMHKIIEICSRNGIYSEASLVRIIRCSHGVCGSCVVEPGLLVCRDGPVFKGETLLKTEFGHFFKNESGMKVKIS